jgi:hypothetical protein
MQVPCTTSYPDGAWCHAHINYYIYSRLTGKSRYNNELIAKSVIISAYVRRGEKEGKRGYLTLMQITSQARALKQRWVQVGLDVRMNRKENVRYELNNILM